MPRVLVPLAQGCEELEAITIIDLLRRADLEVVSAGLDEQPVVASRKTTIVPDTTLERALEEEFDMIVLPGGMPGADHLDNDSRIHDLLKSMADSGKFVAAICAAPKVLANAGLLKGKQATSYPGFIDSLGLDEVKSTGTAVECDGNIITSRGAGTAMDFALKLIEVLVGTEKRDAVENALVRA